jgi:hypothetical protein
MRRQPPLEFFSLGGLLFRFWTPRSQLLPWLSAAITLSLLACWDLAARGGSVDFIMLGLAGYELVIGLTEEPDTNARR